MSPAYEPPEKQSGDVIRSAEWNAAVQEVRRLGAAKLDRDGPATLTGPLNVASGLTVGGDLEVSGRITRRGAPVDPGGGWGARQERHANQEYTAEADGLVTAWLRAEGTAGGTLIGETPAGTPRMVVALPPMPPPPPPEPLPPVLRQRLTAKDAASDLLGYAVAVSGDTAVVGAYGKDVPVQDCGAAYVFVRNGEQWVRQAQLVAKDPAASDYFGYAVAVSGDTAVVGAYWKDARGADSGAAYVFVRRGEKWEQQARLLHDDAAASDYFGYAVAVSGDTAVVGAPGKDDRGGDAGAAYVFVRQGEQWVQQTRLEPSDPTGEDRFGHAVAVAGDTAVIGAYPRDARGIDSGAAYIFIRRGWQWVQQAWLVPDDGGANDHFGRAVAVSGESALIGAHQKIIDGKASAGAAYVYQLPRAAAAEPAPRADGFTLPVRRGETWMVRLADVQGTCTVQVYWLPLGASEGTGTPPPEGSTPAGGPAPTTGRTTP